jgi:aspartate/methionine/tyrosine aminotransferase
MLHDPRSITVLEVLAIDGRLNLSDGHPRMKPTPSQGSILARMPDLFEESSRKPLEEIESEARKAFFNLIGQHHGLSPEITTRFCFSSSTAIDIVGKAMSQRKMRVGVLHPTFDNIPDLLKGHGCELVPLDEDGLFDNLEVIADQVDAVLIVTPNNPTGRVLSDSEFFRLATMCKEHELLLVIDSCFRAQVKEAQYDSYKIAESVGVDWIMIEDTGKLWPLLELKCGFLSWPSRLEMNLDRNYSDLMLSSSPFILSLIREFAEDAANGGSDEFSRLVKKNRALLRSTLSELDFSIASGSQISVDLARLPDHLNAQSFYKNAKSLGIHVLPGEAFFWAQRGIGNQYIRFSLARNTSVIEAGIPHLQELLSAPLMALPR